MAEVNPLAAGLLGVVIACETVSVLMRKGLISEDEGVNIYQNSVSRLAAPQEQADAKAILNGLMTNLNL
ncbi:hypothetical protein ACQKE8_13090 [Sphingobium limneticum]|uniref:hypothetical protein n=1 Tax=Sphingobium limneticum TaxID=1007511 RepID=UPI003D0390CF